jgi:HK97 family phage prohead protease
MASDRPWSDFSPSDYSPDEWRAACLLDRGTGSESDMGRYELPVREPGGALNVNGLAAAAGRLDQVQGISPGQREGLARKIVQLYSEANMSPPDHLKEMVDAEPVSQRADNQAPVEHRSATVRNVDFGERIITVLAVPYEESTPVEYRGQIWREVFSRSAFNGFEPNKRRVPVSAKLKFPAHDHVDSHLVGKVSGAYPERGDGLVLDMRISNTPAGDETLQLAMDDALSPSVGFAARSGDQQLDRRSMVRRVNRAFLDHVSMVPIPAYDGAKVLAMRAADSLVPPRELVAPNTPSLDDFYADPLFQWAEDRLK